MLFFSIPFLSSYQKRPAEINNQATVVNTKIPISLEAATAQKQTTPTEGQESGD